MASNAEVIKDLDIDQLENLIRQAQEKLSTLKEGPRVQLWDLEVDYVSVLTTRKYSNIMDFLYNYTKSTASVKEIPIKVQALYCWESEVEEYLT